MFYTIMEILCIQFFPHLVLMRLQTFVHFIGLIRESAHGLMNSSTKSRCAVLLCEWLSVRVQFSSGSGRRHLLWGWQHSSSSLTGHRACCQHKYYVVCVTLIPNEGSDSVFYLPHLLVSMSVSKVLKVDFFFFSLHQIPFLSRIFKKLH